MRFFIFDDFLGNAHFAKRACLHTCGIKNEQKPFFMAGVAGSSPVVRNNERIGNDAGFIFAFPFFQNRFGFRFFSKEKVGEADGILIQPRFLRKFFQFMRNMTWFRVEVAPCILRMTLFFQRAGYA